MPDPKKNVAFTTWVGLIDSASRPTLKANPTLAAGDVTVSIDGGAFANLGTLPDAEPNSSAAIRVILAQAEMNGDCIIVKFQDAAGAEWDDLMLVIHTTTQTVDDLATQTSVNTIDDFLDTEVAAILAAVDTEVAAILADTNELQTDWVDGGRLDLLIDAIKAKTDTLPDGVRKNVELANFMFLLVDSTDHVTPKTGVTVTAERSLDGAAFAACANAVSEVSAGWYKITLANTDLNGDVVALKFTGTGADARNITIVTQA